MFVDWVTFKPLLPVVLTALGFLSFLKVCRFVYRASRRMKKGVM